MYFARDLLWRGPIGAEPGESRTQSAVIGPPSEAGTPDEQVTTEVQQAASTLTVGFREASFPPELFQATVRAAHRAQQYGPIDLPFSLQVAGPVEVLITPATEVSADVGVVLQIQRGCCYVEGGATRTRAVIGGAALVLAPWVSAVQVFNSAGTICSWRDSAAVVLGTFSSNIGQVPRPRAAFDLLVADNALVTELYQ